MTAVSREAIAWTEDQEAVIGAPISARMLVVADAGTGKTAVLVARLEHLIRSEDVAPGAEVLTLCFTRDAVAEIRRRLDALGGPAAYATVSTFDSYATRLLSWHQPEGDWSEGGYDDRIRAATQLVVENDDAGREISRLRHFFVDEIQDLVGIRLDFVRVLLRTLTGGFTLLGDPAQAIYDWQAKGEKPERIFAWLRKEYADLVERRLTGNFRAETEITRGVLNFGARLAEPDPNYEAIADDLLRLADGLPSFGSVERLAAALRRTSVTNAVLCRTNGQALVLSELLWQRDVAHTLKREASERAVTAWVGRLMAPLTGATLRKRTFLNAFTELGLDTLDPDEAWGMIRRLDPSRTDGVAVDSVRRRIASQYVPDGLCTQPPSNVVVSTIHRAKGLEFAGVVLIRYDDDRFGTDDLAEETRTLYVAMTRPRRHIMSLPQQSMNRVWRDPTTDRWFRGGPKRWQTMGFELHGDDTHRTQPPGGFLLDEDAAQIQDYLWTRVKTGDPIEMHLAKAVNVGRITAYYALLHQSKPIGVTSESFGATLHRRLHRSDQPGRWPRAITGIRIEALDTVAGTSAASENNGLGSAGIWLRPRLVGLGVLEW